MDARNFLPSPFRPSPIAHLKKQDKTNSAVISSEIVYGEELQKTPLISNKIDELCKLSTNITKENAPAVAEQLEQYVQELQKEFFSANNTNLEQQAKELLDKLNKEKPVYRGDPREDYDIYNVAKEIHPLKLCLFKQEYLLKESELNARNDLANSPLHKLHNDEIETKVLTASTRSNFYGLSRRNFFEKEHKQENIAALFSSSPEKIQNYLKMRQAAESQRG